MRLAAIFLAIAGIVAVVAIAASTAPSDGAGAGHPRSLRQAY